MLLDRIQNIRRDLNIMAEEHDRVSLMSPNSAMKRIASEQVEGHGALLMGTGSFPQIAGFAQEPDLKSSA